MNRAVPLLRIFDEAAAKAFYLDFLGFDLVFEHRFDEGFPLYAGIQRGAVLLHLSGHHGDCTPGSAVFVELDDVDAYHAELATRPNPNMRPSVEVMPWGTRQMAVTDPFGNRLLFNSPVH